VKNAQEIELLKKEPEAAELAKMGRILPAQKA
jgi:hypothetical protein